MFMHTRIGNGNYVYDVTQTVMQQENQVSSV